jgi:hypothetical protein
MAMAHRRNERVLTSLSWMGRRDKPVSEIHSISIDDAQSGTVEETKGNAGVCKSPFAA